MLVGHSLNAADQGTISYDSSFASRVASGCVPNSRETAPLQTIPWNRVWERRPTISFVCISLLPTKAASGNFDHLGRLYWDCIGAHPIELRPQAKTGTPTRLPLAVLAGLPSSLGPFEKMLSGGLAFCWRLVPFEMA